MHLFTVYSIQSRQGGGETKRKCDGVRPCLHLAGGFITRLLENSPVFVFELGPTRPRRSCRAGAHPAVCVLSNPAAMSQDCLFLQQQGGITSYEVRPLVIFNILDNFQRRNADQFRVVGTLLGQREGSTVVITNSFPVPHTETDDSVRFCGASCAADVCLMKYAHCVHLLSRV